MLFRAQQVNGTDMTLIMVWIATLMEGLAITDSMG